ncbi:restriction endonuclease subunit S [Sporofaciens sp. SGI.106]|uniref:restriction endonuclease subunit S n=1 Tax=Sporofaciens sp. SGI.106 TaxID=3420568 RepID=UPI003CFF32DA
MAMIRPETEMKDSGVQWLGNIPKEWSVGKVKHEFYATKTIVGDKVNDYERLALTLNGVIKRSKDAGDGLQPEKFDGYQILKEHELVFKLIDLANVSTSRVGLSPYTGIVSPAYIVLHHRKDMNPRYGEYYFLSMWMNEVFNHIGGDGVRSALNAKDLLNIPYLKVSPDEQQAIADYLDETCSKIDEIIAEAKASIDEYKELKQSVIFEAVTKGLDKNVEMKDSGVEWIGKIPASWDVLRIKDIGAARNGLTYSPNDQVDSGKGTLVLRSSNVQNGQIVFDDNVYVNKDIPDNLMLDEGDILICSRNGSRRLIGKNAIVPESGKYTFGAFMMVLKPFNDNKKYIHWILNSGVFGYYLPMFFTSTINQLTRENFRNMQIPYCMDVNVQKDIVEYLDKKCELFDSLIAEKESLINDLETYKKSLIYEVVTGKRRVV